MAAEQKDVLIRSESSSDCSLAEVADDPRRDVRELVREALASSLNELRHLIQEMRDIVDRFPAARSDMQAGDTDVCEVKCLRAQAPVVHLNNDSEEQPHEGTHERGEVQDFASQATAVCQYVQQGHADACQPSYLETEAFMPGGDCVDTKQSHKGASGSGSGCASKLPQMALSSTASRSRVQPEPGDDLGTMAETRPQTTSNPPPFHSLMPQQASKAWASGSGALAVDSPSQGAEDILDACPLVRRPVKPNEQTNVSARQDIQSGGQEGEQPSGSSQAERMRHFVKSGYFETFSFVLVLLNSLMLGVETNFHSRHVGRDVDAWVFVVTESIFCFLFTVELLLRICAHGKAFLWGPGWSFNMMDTFLVVTNLLQLIFQGGGQASIMEKLSILRVLRSVRLVRLIRLYKVLKHVRDLRALVISIGASFKALVWTIVLLLMLIYCGSLVITHAVFEKRQTAYESGLDINLDELTLFFGDLGLTMLSMFEALFGGQDWDAFLRPLMVHISPWMALPWGLYIAFGMLTILNAITGVFVDNVLQCTRRTEEVYLVNNVRQLFSQIPGGSMDWPVFERMLDSEAMEDALEAINLEPSDARGLFRLLDADSSGCVNAEEFVAGCLRLRGPAKALDLAVLHLAVKRLGQQLRSVEITRSDSLVSAGG